MNGCTSCLENTKMSLSYRQVNKLWAPEPRRNQAILECYGRTLRDLHLKANEAHPLFARLEALSLGNAILESAKVHPDSEDVIHLVMGGTLAIYPQFITRVLRQNHIDKQRVVSVLPDYGKNRDINFVTLDLEVYVGPDQVKNTSLASVYVVGNHTGFNWEHYKLDLSPGTYLIFKTLDFPIENLAQVVGWSIYGQLGNTLYLRREEYEVSSNDSDQGSEPESPTEEL